MIFLSEFHQSLAKLVTEPTMKPQPHNQEEFFIKRPQHHSKSPGRTSMRAAPWKLIQSKLPPLLLSVRHLSGSLFISWSIALYSTHLTFTERHEASGLLSWQSKQRKYVNVTLALCYLPSPWVTPHLEHVPQTCPRTRTTWAPSLRYRFPSSLPRPTEHESPQRSTKGSTSFISTLSVSMGIWEPKSGVWFQTCSSAGSYTPEVHRRCLVEMATPICHLNKKRFWEGVR